MIEIIVHQETFSHSIDQMILYVISIKGDLNIEVQNLIEEKRIQTIFLLENQEQLLNLENITKSLASKSLEDKCEILFKEIYEAKKNIALLISEGKNETLLFFASYMILQEKKNQSWLYEQTFYQTFQKTEQEVLQNLIKNSPDTLGSIFLNTEKLKFDNQFVQSEIIHTDKPQNSEAIDLNPPFLVGSQFNQPIFPTISLDSQIIGPTDKLSSQTITNTIINDIQKSQVKIGNDKLIKDDQQLELQEQEETIKELAPPIQFQSFYQKYTIKCFK
ncbi:unnamed protein product (macronuclear) [Paramecium tetraurelia]|uniref:Uncharacterized protein n=1 Tax=Paramecium tetraurelia TaxID=5888 RepID=A0DNX2_PARTE|nr:uncharacterized protein GSPATT00018935001 [Paramecium tetraurelia]CAK84739.1 unnamed protein product [Paramecium tetraurelia]|eukprot:XP_001452136.1 hypothetical protein (macronuclear) [Paramecium tetraurelia strain d4-2]